MNGYLMGEVKMTEDEISIMLKVDLQYPDWWKKGTKFIMNKETGHIFGIDKKTKIMNEYPIRAGLQGYLWLLYSEKKFCKIINN